MGCLWVKGKSNKALLFAALSFLLVFNGNNTLIAPVDGKSKLHIVYLGAKQNEDPELLTDLHHDMLASVVGSKEAAIESMVYSYKHGFSGFAAKLTESQAKKISDLSGVVHVMPNSFYTLQTTRSWDYLGLSSHSSTNLMRETNMGDGVIIGIIDTGIWPESKMLNDHGVGPIPTRWKGRCESGKRFNAKTDCNRKLIGAKWFRDAFRADHTAEFGDILSPRDEVGHGTHCATTAAGSFVAKASYKGLALGVVRGGAPRAHLAVYKACWNVTTGKCTYADMLKAIDVAINDGVDVLSLSVAFDNKNPIDPIAIGSFHAVAKGITVVCAAGNDGPDRQTVANVAPWIITVAATTLNRSFPTPITLGNSKTLLGQAMFVGKEVGFTSLVYLGGPEFLSTAYGACDSVRFNDPSVAGNVVISFPKEPWQKVVAVCAVRNAGGVGIIIAGDRTNQLGPCVYNFPCIEVDNELGNEIMFYILSTRSPIVKLSPSKTLTGKPVSTKVARFSSRGPNSIAPTILKPDIAAPGVNILAASPAGDGGFALLSGTSMAAPHITGIVALIKSLHPDWSPAAMKSALITTAWKTDPFGEPIFAEGAGRKLADPFDYGGGLVNPNKAAHPGLIYDMGTNDYINYLCASGYSTSAIFLIVKQATSCPVTKPSILDLNLPSITIPNLRNPITVTRTVTNVGPVNSTYKAKIDPPPGINVVVRPETLVFTSRVKTISFSVAVSTTYRVNTAYFFGSLTWTDGVHAVTSPISVRTQILRSYTDDN